jgi:hypothetical protein
VRQVVCSARRDDADWSVGALWPNSRPVTTTARTPDAPMASAGRNATNGARNERVVSRTGSSMRRRMWASTPVTARPTSAPPPAATTNSQAMEPTVTLWVRAVMAAAYSSGGRRPTSTRSGSSSMLGTPGTNDAGTTPTITSTSGGDHPRLRERPATKATVMTMARTSRAVFTTGMMPGRGSGGRARARGGGFCAPETTERGTNSPA